MYYIKRNAGGVEVYDGHTVHTLSSGMQSVFNSLCLKELTTFKGRMDALKKHFERRYNLPVYINETMCFYGSAPIRRPEAVYVNFFDVLSLRDLGGRTEILFKDLSVLLLDVPYERMHRRHQGTKAFLRRIKMLSLSSR